MYLDFMLLACHKLWCYNTDLHWGKLALGILIFGFLEEYYHRYNLPPAASLYKAAGTVTWRALSQEKLFFFK